MEILVVLLKYSILAVFQRTGYFIIEYELKYREWDIPVVLQKIGYFRMVSADGVGHRK